MNAMPSMSPCSTGIADRDRLAVVARHDALPSCDPFLADTSAALLRTIAEVLDNRRVSR